MNSNSNNALEGLVKEINKRGAAGNEGNGRSEEEKTSENDLLSVRNILLATVIMLASSMPAFLIAGIAGVVIVILLFATVAMGIYSIYVFFAPRDLFFTGIREGTAKMIMAGTRKDPKFVRAVMAYKEYTLDENYNIIQGTAKKSILPGLVFIGIPLIHWVYIYDFEWSSRTQKGEIKTKKEPLDYVYTKADVYFAKVKGAEVGESMVHEDLELLLTIRVVNPYRALFRVEKWLEFVLNRAEVPIRDYVSAKDNPRDLIVEMDSLGDKFLKKLEESGDLKEFEENYGIRLLHIETPAIDLGEWQETATAQWKAVQEGEAQVIKDTKAGEAYQAKRAKEKEADMDYLGGVYSKIIEFGDTGTTLRFLDTLTEAAKGPSNTIIPFGMIQDIARQVLGAKSSGIIESLTVDKKVTKGDIEDVKEAVKKSE